MNLPGRDNDDAEEEYNAYLNATAEFIAATNLLKLLTQEINKIRSATNTLGELAGFLGNISFINTLEMIITLSNSLPHLVNAISIAGTGLLDRGTITKEMTASAWYQNLTALGSFHKLISGHSIEINTSVNQMLQALKNDQIQGKFEGILADLETQLSAATVNHSNELKEQKKDQKEITDEQAQPVIQLTESRPVEKEGKEIKVTRAQIKYTTEIHTFFSTLTTELKTCQCMALAQTLEDAKTKQPAQGIKGATLDAFFSKFTFPTAIINPADYFKVVHYPKFDITGNLMSLIDDYRAKKEASWLRFSHESTDITDPKVLLIGIVLTYKEEFERTISLGDSHSQTAFQILHELSEVIRVFATIKPFSQSSDPSNSCIALAQNMQAKLQGDFARKALLDKQKVIYDNARKLNNSVKVIFYDLSKSLLEICTGKFAGDIFGNSAKKALIKECGTYAEFKRLAKEKKMDDIFDLVSDEEIFKVVKFLHSPQNKDSSILFILLKKYTERFKGKVLLEDEKKLQGAVIQLIHDLGTLRKQIQQQSKLTKGLQDIGEIGVLLNPKTSESLHGITLTLQSVQTSLDTIQTDAPSMFRRNNIDTDSLGLFPKENLVTSSIAETIQAADSIQAEITPEKLAEQFSQALETIVNLKAYNEKDQPRIERAWQICQLIKAKKTDQIAGLFAEDEAEEEEEKEKQIKADTSGKVITMGGDSKFGAILKKLEHNAALLSQKQKAKNEIALNFDAVILPLEKTWRVAEMDHYKDSCELENLQKKEIPDLEKKVEASRPWFEWLASKQWLADRDLLNEKKQEAAKLIQSKDQKKHTKELAFETFKNARKPLVDTLNMLETDVKRLGEEGIKLSEELLTMQPPNSKNNEKMITEDKKQDVSGLSISKEQIKSLITAIETGLHGAEQEYGQEEKAQEVKDRFGEVQSYFETHELGQFSGPEDLAKRLSAVLIAADNTRKTIEAKEGTFSTSATKSKVVFRNHFNLEINKNKKALAVLLGLKEKDLVNENIEVRYKKPDVVLTTSKASFTLSSLAQKKLQVAEIASDDVKAALTITLN